MILHVWRAEVSPARLDDYRRFERERRLPMLRRRPGYLGALFLRGAGDLASSATIWEDRGAVEALESSPRAACSPRSRRRRPSRCLAEPCARSP